MTREPSSFRDYDSILEFDDFFYYRSISENYFKHYDHFIKSGLKEYLLLNNYILPFNEIIANETEFDYCKIKLKTNKIPFISYPYEWSFEQFKEAALFTLKVNAIALEYGMILKDASMFNVQFIGCEPIFIDISSFEIYENGKPWQGYYQFCKHFYGPIFLASKKNGFIPKLLQYFIDGIPLKETVSLSNFTSLFSSGAFLHLYLHSRNEGKLVNSKKNTKLSKSQLLNILNHLKDSINKLKQNSKESIWNDYNQNNNYLQESKSDKSAIIQDYLGEINGHKALDLGANDGFYSSLLANKGYYTLVVDIDELAIDRAFTINKNKYRRSIHPLQVNLANPTPAIGWNNIERKSFWERCNVDVIQALAIIHHLTITHDISFEQIAKKISKHTNYLIIEYVYPNDSQAQILLQNKPHHSSYYNLINFESAFESYFKLKRKSVIKGSERVLFLYESKKCI